MRELKVYTNNYRVKTKHLNGYEESIYAHFANEAEAESMYVKLIEEFDNCFLSYFAFHGIQVPFMISQVLFHVPSLKKKILEFRIVDKICVLLQVKNDESKKKPRLKKFVMAATRGETDVIREIVQDALRKGTINLDRITGIHVRD